MSCKTERLNVSAKMLMDLQEREDTALPLLRKELSETEKGLKNIADKDYQKAIIDIFVNAGYLYDDRIVLIYNFKDETRTVMLTDIEFSELPQITPPQTLENTIFSRVIFFVRTLKSDIKMEENMLVFAKCLL